MVLHTEEKQSKGFETRSCKGLCRMIGRGAFRAAKGYNDTFICFIQRLQSEPVHIFACNSADFYTLNICIILRQIRRRQSLTDVMFITFIFDTVVCSYSEDKHKRSDYNNKYDCDCFQYAKKYFHCRLLSKKCHYRECIIIFCKSVSCIRLILATEKTPEIQDFLSQEPL